MEWKNPLFTYCDSHETFILMSIFSMKTCPQMKYEYVVQRKEGHNVSYHVPKRQNVEKKINIWYSKVQISKRTRTENLHLLGFFLDKQVC